MDEESLPSGQARKPSREQSSVETHKSSFAGTRQASEESKNIRFVDQDLIDHHPRNQQHRPSFGDPKKWRNVRRRMSIKPIGKFVPNLISVLHCEIPFALLSHYPFVHNYHSFTSIITQTGMRLFK
ncbi:unnamed protein product [Strongylus vulgaris]|uniref:Uncharacterized protein n=1 Tax=Strongylus vulgaris TaxID=40348 RepID=A0A3P7KXG0_STRVU|nr:unnamed protein product [Strongylus vulgaris]